MSSPDLHGHASLRPYSDHGGLLLTHITMTVLEEKGSDKKIYEIGYLLVSSIPGEKVANVTASLKDILSKKKAEIIAEEAPELRDLAYTMIKKIGSVNHRFDQAYFGWVKFELSQNQIEDVKKSFELHPDMLRMLLITTIKENTYLSKKAPVLEALENSVDGNVVQEALPVVGIDEAVPIAPASVEDMDKSIDEMVKGA